MGEWGRKQFTIPDSRYKCCDSESRRRLIQLMTNCRGEISPDEISPGLEAPCNRAGYNRSQWRSLHPHKFRPRQGF